jgi:hypothetical protein
LNWREYAKAGVFNNIASLRPQLPGERFERGRFLGKTLLYGAGVQ